MQRALSLDGVQFSYGKRQIIAGIDLEIDAGESVAVIGRSGVGKSTLLSLVVGLMRPSSGAVRILDARVDTMSRSRLAEFRRQHIGVLFQAGELLPSMTAVENVSMPLLLDGTPWLLASERARQLLSSLGIDGASHDLPAGTLSGGERQRAALARALVIQPELIIADEPTGSLDQRTRNEIADLLFSLPMEHGCALLLVTHDLDLASRAGTQYELADGLLKVLSGM